MWGAVHSFLILRSWYEELPVPYEVLRLPQPFVVGPAMTYG